ncbi:MAG: hypothetical protein F4X44_07025 [Gammaproteobacteria bacterium]|nr:hypothetical protein [Gammaproteobacteria bacterium]MYD80348.1 hypothetical protein [Gammaproteobacteria bacterium]
MVDPETQATVQGIRHDPMFVNGESGKDGSFSFGPFPKSCVFQVVARKDQIQSSRERTMFASTHELELRLLNSTHLVGFVSDAETSEPLDEFVLWPIPG